MLKLEEPIRVAVIFGPGGTIRPVWFDWRRRKHAVKEVTYTWSERAGAATLLHFTVTADGALWELVYDSERQSWMLAALETA